MGLAAGWRGVPTEERGLRREGVGRPPPGGGPGGGRGGGCGPIGHDRVRGVGWRGAGRLLVYLHVVALERCGHAVSLWNGRAMQARLALQRC